MKTITATALRQNLFQVLAKASRSQPTRIRYKKGEAIITSYRQYMAKSQKGTLKRGKGLEPLIRGKVVKPLGEQAKTELLRYIRIYK